MTDREGHNKGKAGIDGTEGGVSEKERNKLTKGGLEKEEKKRPESPKELADHHEHEKDKISNSQAGLKDLNKEKGEKGEKGIGGLEVGINYKWNDTHGSTSNMIIETSRST
jgi:hypothetical protein